MPKYEKSEDLSEESKNSERARQSLIEEFEAIDWYQERIDASRSDSLRKILEHNRDEEKEHAAMPVEWVRKNDPTQDEKSENTTDQTISSYAIYRQPFSRPRKMVICHTAAVTGCSAR